MRIGESLEEFPAGSPEIGGSQGIHTRDSRDLRGKSWQKSREIQVDSGFSTRTTYWISGHENL
jgi:hypothetical protein